MIETTDPAFARRMLERAIAHESKPTLSAEAVDDLMQIAARTTDDSGTIYTAASLNAAAATGWNWKAALSADKYDLGAGNGRTLTQSQWHAHCRAMAASYGRGEMDVLNGTAGGTSGTTRVGSVGLTTSTAVTYPADDVLPMVN
jgi:hypothetical protein